MVTRLNVTAPVISLWMFRPLIAVAAKQSLWWMPISFS